MYKNTWKINTCWFTHCLKRGPLCSYCFLLPWDVDNTFNTIPHIILLTFNYFNWKKYHTVSIIIGTQLTINFILKNCLIHINYRGVAARSPRTALQHPPQGTYSTEQNQCATLLMPFRLFSAFYQFITNKLSPEPHQRKFSAFMHEINFIWRAKNKMWDL